MPSKNFANRFPSYIFPIVNIYLDSYLKGICFFLTPVTHLVLSYLWILYLSNNLNLSLESFVKFKSKHKPSWEE